MTDLIDRLSKLEGTDREVDAIIECEAGDEVFWGHRLGKNKGTVVAYFDRPNGDIGHSTHKAPRYTASVDAAIALAERVLPGWKRQLFEDFNGKWIARICSQRRELFSTDYLRETELGGSPNGAIALCIAILRAKEASKP